MKNPLISVVIPVYNTDPYLERCLESVVNQTYQNLQIIVINDGSTDNSAEICQKFANKDNRIEFINKDNEGVSVARNIGIKESNGEWIYFLDSDDYLEIETFDKLLETNVEYGAEIIQFGMRTLKDGKVVVEKKSSNFKRFHNLEDFFTRNEVKPLSLAVHLFSLKLIKDNGLYFKENLKYAEDLLFMYSIYFCANKYISLDKIFYNHILSLNSATRKPIEIKVLYDYLFFLKEICKNVSKADSEKFFHKEFFYLTKYLFVLPTLIHDKKTYINSKVKIQKIYRNIYKENRILFKNPILLIALMNFNLIALAIKSKQRLKAINVNYINVKI